MGYGVLLQPPTDVMAAINDTALQSPGLMATAYTRATSRLRSRWRSALRVEPPAAKNYYKLPWASDAQRIAVIIKLKKQGNLPYERSGDLAQGWDVVIDSAEDGGSITATNDAPESIYVYGDEDTLRQPMFDEHVGGIPWLDPVEVNNTYLDEAEEVLIQTWFSVTDPFAGVEG